MRDQNYYYKRKAKVHLKHFYNFKLMASSIGLFFNIFDFLNKKLV